MTRRAWTFEELATLRRVYPTEGAPAAAAVLGRSKHSVHNKARQLGLDGKSRDWPAEDQDALRRLYPHHSAAAVAAVLGRKPGAVWAMAQKLGLTKSAEFMASERSGRRQRGQVHPSIQHTQFKPGQAPWNKGTHFHAGGRSVLTQFKTRAPEESRNYKPIGSYRISAGDGLLERKVTDDRSLEPARRWVAVHRLVWEEANGPIPRGHIVVFKPGMRTNVLELITLDRLECISRAENATRNQARQNPELRALYQLKGAITRQVNRINKEAQESQAA